jgi:dihydroorotase-like cyclic amidohydrolase
VLEGEATGRAIRLASFVGVPLYVVHVMSIDAMEEVRNDFLLSFVSIWCAAAADV